MTWEGEAPSGRLTKRQRTWRMKRSVRVLGADGIPPVENPAGTVVMDGPANVLESSQYRDPLAVYEAPRPLTREDLERGKAALLDAGKSRQEFMLFLDANAAEVATWPKWKRDAYALIKEPSDG